MNQIKENFLVWLMTWDLEIAFVLLFVPAIICTMWYLLRKYPDYFFHRDDPSC